MDNEILQKLNVYYNDPESDIFLSKNINQILKFAKNKPELGKLTKSEILKYMQSISDISRDRERRILRGKRRVLSTRQYIFWGPHNIMLGDCFFIRNMRNPKFGKHHIGVIFMDGFR